MSFIVTIAGQSFTLPTEGDENWAAQQAAWSAAVSTDLLQRSGGSFTLTNNVNFGASFGLISAYFTSRTANASTAGAFRLARVDSIGWRNQANGGNLLLGVDSSDRLTYNGEIVQTNPGGVVTPGEGGTGISSYTAGDMLYATGSVTLAKLAIGTVNFVQVSTGSAPSWALIVNANVDAAAAIAYSKLNLSGSIVNADVNASAAIAYSKLNLSGSIVNADVNASAAIAYSKLNLSGSIVNADINASAAVAFSKLASLTSAHILVGSGSNVATDVAVSGDITLSNAGAVALVATTNATLATLSKSTGVAVHGTNTNDSASAGFVGEYVESKSAGPNNFPSSGDWGDAGNISLTAGDWDVTMQVAAIPAASSTFNHHNCGISTTTGNSSTGLNQGENLMGTLANVLTNSSMIGALVSDYRMSLSGTTTVYGKVQASYTGGSPTYGYRLSARRVR